MSELDCLLRELATDANLRRAFSQSPIAVLRARGYDVSKFSVPDQMDLATLEAQLQTWAAEQGFAEISGEPTDVSVSDPPIISPVEPLLSSNSEARSANTPQDGARVRHRLGQGRRLAQESAERSSEPSGLLGQTRSIPPFSKPRDLSAIRGRQESARAYSAPTGVAERGASLPAGQAPNVVEDVSESKSAMSETGAREYPSAWFGSYGTAVSRAIVTGAEASRLVPETIVGADDRVRVTDARQYPFRWLCRLVILAANGTLWSGTGWLAGPRLVLTAGHCVYMHNQGGWAERIQVFLYDENGDLAAPLDAEDAASVNGWVTDANPEQDYAAITLPAGFSTSGWFGFGSFPDHELAASIGNIAGFPVDKPAGALWGHARRLSEVRANTLFYEIDTYGGMSGAPVICWNGGDYIVVGIHNYGDIAGNRATRINPTVYRDIESWLAAHA